MGIQNECFDTGLNIMQVRSSSLVGALIPSMAVFAVLALAACQSPTEFESEVVEDWPTLAAGALELPVVVIDDVHGSFSGIQTHSRSVIADPASWRAFWDEHQAFIEPKRDPPAIDFSNQMVITASMGGQSSGGYSIDIEGVFQVADGMVVRVVETSPGMGCIVTMAITHPVTAVAVPHASLESVKFLEKSTTADCS